MGPEAKEAYKKLIQLSCTLSQRPRRSAGYAALLRDYEAANAEYEVLRAAGR